jgi:hypothetical protein
MKIVKNFQKVFCEFGCWELCEDCKYI